MAVFTEIIQSEKKLDPLGTSPLGNGVKLEIVNSSESLITSTKTASAIYEKIIDSRNEISNLATNNIDSFFRMLDYFYIRFFCVLHFVIMSDDFSTVYKDIGHMFIFKFA